MLFFNGVLNSDLWVSSISSSSYWDLIYPAVSVHSASSATITVAGKTFTSDASGNTQHSMPWGTFSISDSVSGQSFECTIDRDTTDVYVMPEHALYWYGNECTWLTGGWNKIISGNYSTLTSNQQGLYLSCTTISEQDYSCAITKNKVNVNSYTVFNTLYKAITVLSDNSLINGFDDDGVIKGNFESIKYAFGGYTSKNTSLKSIDISKYTDSYYVANLATGTRAGHYHAIWLE